MLPCFVPLSILIAHYIEELKDRPDEKISKVNASINIAFWANGYISRYLFFYTVPNLRFMIRMKR